MLEYFREVERTGEPLIVTDRGREVLEVRPVGAKEPASVQLASIRERLFGSGKAAGISEEDLLAREWPEPEICEEAWLEEGAEEPK